LQGYFYSTNRLFHTIKLYTELKNQIFYLYFQHFNFTKNFSYKVGTAPAMYISKANYFIGDFMTAPLPSRLTFGQPVEFDGLAIAPIYRAPDQSPLSYLTLDTAFDQSDIEITETSDSGNVPELSFENKAGVPVLLLDGEELIGAKQNRVVNLTVLVPASCSIVIPVSCVESGRWNYSSHNFGRTDRAHFARGRAKKMASVSRSLRESGSHRSDQGEVWSEIDRKFAAMNMQSNTSAMADMYQDAAPTLDGYVEEFQPDGGQVGAFYFVHGQFVGMEVFDQSDTFAALNGKLVKSYAIDVLETQPSDRRRASLSEAIRFIESLEGGEWESYQSIGMGKDHRLLSNRIASAALVSEGRVVHLSGFINEEDSMGYRPGQRHRRSL
jgi:ARG and Rhodanese-Phosphatase-superfamily-associated Protein domain